MSSATLSVTIGEVDPLAFLSSEQVKPQNQEKITYVSQFCARILRLGLAIDYSSIYAKSEM